MTSHVFSFLMLQLRGYFMRIDPVWHLQYRHARHFPHRRSVRGARPAAISRAELAGGTVKIEDVDHRRHRRGISATNRIHFPRNLCLQPSVIVFLLPSRCLETRQDSPIIAAESRRIRLTFAGEKIKKTNKKKTKIKKNKQTGYNRQRRSRIPPPGSASTISGVNAIGQTNQCLTWLHFLLR